MAVQEISSAGKLDRVFDAIADFFELSESVEIQQASRDPRDDEMSLDELFELYEKRPGVSYEMLSMAHFFGLSKQQIAHPNVEGRLRVERCNRCLMGVRCFKDRNGKRRKNPGFGRDRCANIETYRQLARENGKRSPIHYNMYQRLLFWMR